MLNDVIDKEDLIEFIDESRDDLQGVEGAFIELENDPGNLEIINRIFRPVHSLKGSAGFFDLMNINKFAHRLENLLDLLRNGELFINTEIVNVLLKGIEFLEAMLDRAEVDPSDNMLRQEEKDFITVIENCKPSPVSGSIKSVVDLENLLNEALDLGIVVDNVSLFSKLLTQIEQTNQEIKHFIKQQKAASLTTPIFSPAKKYIYNTEQKNSDQLKKIGEILIDENAVTQDELDDALKKQKRIGEILLEDGKIRKEDLQQAIGVQNKQLLKEQIEAKQESTEVIKSIRIDQSKLDTFANYVGELFINTDGFTYLKKEMDAREVDLDIISKFTKMITTFDSQIESLHESVMDIRKLPAKTLFQRFPKMVRQLSVNAGKNIKFVVAGEDTVVDKDVIEKIEKPLVHILRNSVDHGLEPPEERVANKKNEQGTIELKASADENYFFIKLVDDGRGIDPAKMKELAIKKGFLSESKAAECSEKELINLIFRPGFSTADKITDVSGRGVGMDVVISAVKECRGEIDVDSTLGKGTTISIKIPVSKTLVAVEAMLVETAHRVYAINSDEISTTIKLQEDTTELLDEGKCIQYDHSIFKIIDLHKFFYKTTNSSSKKDQVLILSMEHKVALLVDKVINHQKIVVKDFSGGYPPLKVIRGVKGYTILGNEEIALIVDVRTLVANA